MYMRLPLTALLGGAIAICVFWLLWFLISQPINVATTVKATRINFTQLKQDTQVQTKEPDKVQRQPPPPTPQTPQMNFTNAGVSNNVVQLAPRVNTGQAVGNLEFTAGSDTGVTPLVRIPPQYPPRALSRGIQGWVQVQFTVTETGTVKNVTVVAAQPEGVFEEAAVRAVSRWRYSPKVVNGQPVPRIGVQTVIRFKLSN